MAKKSRSSVVAPSGVKEKAQVGLTLLKDAILELAKANPQGISESMLRACWACVATMAAGLRTTSLQYLRNSQCVRGNLSALSPTVNTLREWNR